MDIFGPKRQIAPRIQLLDADPDLARLLDAQAATEAAEVLRPRVAALDKGVWEPRLWRQPEDTVGLLVLEGAVLRTVSIAQASCGELLGAGDILRPWQRQPDPLPCTVQWEVIEPLRVAVIDGAFMSACARWPQIATELLTRAIARSRWQTALAAVSHVRRVDLRLLLAMWHMAERWGRVTPGGVVIPLRLTHERLAALVGAKRPSVSSALSRLVDRDLLVRRPDRFWMLTRDARRQLEEAAEEPGALARAA